MKHHIGRITDLCICDCGTVAITTRVFVSSKRELWLLWKCCNCQQERKATSSFEELEDIVRSLAQSDERHLKKAGEFTKQDEAYLKEMHIGGK